MINEEDKSEEEQKALEDLVLANEDFEAFINTVASAVIRRPDIPFVHLLSLAIMEIFEPGFVIIGSPDAKTVATHTCEKHAHVDGLKMPDAIGIAVNTTKDLTNQDLIYTLHMMAEAMDEALPTSDDNLAAEFPNE